MRRNFWAALLPLAAVGCASEPALVPVSGLATVDGKPLPAGTVTFYPDAGNPTPTSRSGWWRPAGGTRSPSPAGGEGAPAGKYKVVVYAVDDPQPGKPNRYLTHKKYADPKTTPLRVEVTAAAEPGRYDLKLDR